MIPNLTSHLIKITSLCVEKIIDEILKKNNKPDNISQCLCNDTTQMSSAISIFVVVWLKNMVSKGGQGT